MLRVAKSKRNKAVTFVQVGNDNRLPFASKSFEIVLAAYVAHGMQPEQRLELYSEMKRLSRYLVILHEYNQNRSLLTNIVEYAEGGDYFNFIRIVEDELKGGFFLEIFRSSSLAGEQVVTSAAFLDSVIYYYKSLI